MNQRIFDRAADAEFERTIDEIDFAVATDEERNSVRFVVGYLLTLATGFAFALAFVCLVIFDQQTILSNFYAFWRGVLHV